MSLLFDAYWSDPHFNHYNVINYSRRPFQTLEEMNRELIRRYNQIVRPSDTCLWVGDCFFGPAEAAAEIMSQLNGRKALVRGNHDGPASRMAKLGFDLVVDRMTLNLAGHLVRVSHRPYAGMKSLEPRDTSKTTDQDDTAVIWQRNGSKELLIHGHTHSTRRREGMAIHVGVDAWDYAPATHEEIVALIREAQQQ